MPLDENEKLLVEAISSMLKQDAKLGLSFHDTDNKFDSAERGYEYLHNQIDEMFEVKAAELTHAESVCQAFRMVHNYKYVDDPSFGTAMEKEMVAQAVPAAERKQALDFVPSIIKEIKEEQKEWNEKDAGFSPYLNEIRTVSKPPQPLTMTIHKRNQESNVTWNKTDASPSHTPDD